MRFHIRLVAIIALLLLATSALVHAHEGREVGEYVLVFGWRVEPALVGYPNGPELTIRTHEEEASHGDDHADEHAVELPEVSLEVEVSFGPESRTLTMRPASGTPDHFIADLIPTRAGDYTFRVFGTIGDVAIDETFSSSAGEFSSVDPASDVTFPDQLPSILELLQRIADLEARIQALESGQ